VISVIKVVVADDHPPLREGVKQALNCAQDIHVVAEAGTGPELQAALRSHPDVLLLDISMPQFDVFQELPRLRSEYPELKIVIVTAHDHASFVQRLLKDVHGYLLKEEGMDAYVRAVHAVRGGNSYFSDRVLTAALNSQESPKLTPRELNVLALAAQGLKTAEIAARLFISPRTVETHIENAGMKLGASNRTEAVAKALDLNLISVKAKDAD
jgi:DNA-binding NarL/FixJ family response regulator